MLPTSFKMQKAEKINLLARIKLFIRSIHPARHLEPAPVTLTEQEARFIIDLPQLVPHRFTYEAGEYEGRPALKVTDTYMANMPVTTYFIPHHTPEADGYALHWINDVVHKLNSWQTIKAEILKDKGVNNGAL
jgi:hypothetical protein